MPYKTADLLLAAMRENDESVFHDKMKKLFEYIKNDEMFTGSRFCKYEQVIADNEKCISEVCRIIRSLKWNDCWNVENINSSKINSIINSIVILPEIYKGYMSGVCILYLLHGENVLIISQTLWELKGEQEKILYQTIRDVYFNKKYSYKNIFEKSFGLDFSLFDLPKTTDIIDFKAHITNELFRLMMIYDYFTSSGILKSYINFLSNEKFWGAMWDRDKGVFEEFNKESKEKGWVILRTLLYHNMRKKDLDDISELQSYIYGIVPVIIHYVNTIAQYIVTFEIKRIREKEEDKTKREYINKLLEYVYIKIQNLRLSLDADHYCVDECVKLKKDELIKEVAWIMCWKECRKVLLSKQRFNESESLPIDVFLSTFSRNRNILVRRWNDFAKKYKKILLSFDGTMKSKKTLWLEAVKVIVFSNEKYGRREYNKDIPFTPSDEWYIENDIDIGEIEITTIYSMMLLLKEADKIYVKGIGNDTKRFGGITNEVTNHTLKKFMRTITRDRSESLVAVIEQKRSEIIMKKIMNVDWQKLLYYLYDSIYRYLDNCMAQMKDITNTRNVNKGIKRMNKLNVNVSGILQEIERSEIFIR